MIKSYYAAAWLALGAAALPHLASAQNDQRVAKKELAADGQPALIELSAAGRAAYSAAEGAQVLRQQLALGSHDELRAARTEVDQLGFRHERFQQYYKGVKVEHAAYTAHSRGGQLESLSGDFERVGELSVTPRLSAADALTRALASVGARQYMWQDAQEEAGLKEMENNPAATYRPTGELVVVRDHTAGENGPLVLAWKFNVYAKAPLSRAFVYVDAQTGRVVLSDAIIKHAGHTAHGTRGTHGTAAAASGTFATRYSGTQTSTTDSYNGTYRLRDPSRGGGVQTYNAKRSNSYASPTDFTDADNSWTEYNNANYDNAALDAHWGAQAVYDYWKNVQGRNSYDNAGATIKSFVHFDDTPGDGVGFENAYWNGSVMTYGDGASTFKPLTALDVCAHEIGHAVCETTANLVYQNESGGLNEGFSDIWGAVVENYKAPGKQTWLIGEDIIKPTNYTCLRSMSDPTGTAALSRCPAYYKGNLWAASVSSPTSSNDYGGVHTNSGVLNYWFYILSVGKSGTNEGGNSYSVTGITIGKAANIAYRAESVYLSANSTFADARTYTIKAATDLYGAGSAEVIATTNAWYAVGVGAAYSGGTSCGTPGSLAAGSLSNTGATLSWAAVSGSTSYNVQYRVSGASTWTTVTSTTTSKALTGLTAGTTYQYQVQSVCSGGSSAYSTAATFTTTGGTTTTPTYCASKGGSQSYEYIDLVKIGSINRTSGADGGYYDGSATSTAVAAGSSQTLTLSAGFVSSTYDEYWGVYADWNQNGTFESTERLDYGQVTATAGNVTSTWTVPSTAKNGKVRLRIVMSDNSATTACGTYSYGETEDYSLTVSGGSGLVAGLTGTTSGLHGDATLALYPNPAREQLRLELSSGAEAVKVEVLDVRGALVPAARYQGAGQLDVSHLAAGLYLLRVTDGEQHTYVQRFAKE